MLSQLLAVWAWSPGMRGVLTVAVAIAILIGSVYLIVSTNSGWRLGFLITFTGLMGWMFIMSMVWAMYGIGWQGRAASWHVKEVNTGDLTVATQGQASALPDPDSLPDPEDILADDPALAKQFPEQEGVRRPTLGDLISAKPELAEQFQYPEGWHLLATSDAQTGEASAAASTYLTEAKIFDSASDFVVTDSFSRGGKEQRTDDSTLGRIWFKIQRIVSWPAGHPAHWAAVQVRPVVPQVTLPGEPPPLAKADESAPVTTVIMERDLGTKRLNAVWIALTTGVLFAIGANTLHRRDRRVADARALAATRS